MPEKVGVFLCKCSDNIAARVDIEKLSTELKKKDDVAFVESHKLLCAGYGQEFFENKLKNSDVTHVVVAACSPKDHESTFQRCMTNAGRNKFLLQMANIREQCTWVTPEDDKAYAKSRALTLAAIHRVKYHEALEEKEIDCSTDVVVIGGGIAGMEAALLAAGDGRKVTIVEKSPSLGGKVTQLEEVAPNMECASCLVAPRISQIKESENIDVITDCDIDEIVGYLGNFEIKFTRRARMVNLEACMGCDECIQVCPVAVSSDFDYGMSKRKAIDVLFPGCFPNAAVVDPSICLKTTGGDCNACVEACPMEAMDFSQTDTAASLRCGAVVLATGASQFDSTSLAQYGYGNGLFENDIYTHAQFSRLTSYHGPTGGRVQKQNGEVPKRIVFVHCVGREQLGYCSASCCEAAFGLGLTAMEGDEITSVVHLVSDVMCAGEMGSMLLERVKTRNSSREGVASDGWSAAVSALGENVTEMTQPPAVVRVDDISTVSVKSFSGGASLRFDKAGKSYGIGADMVVLVIGTQPSQSSQRLMKMLDLIPTRRGFAASDHPVLRPASSSLDGVFLTGGVAGIGTIAKSIMSAQAGAGSVLSKLVPGKKLILKSIVAYADETLCSACALCAQVCPYAAVKIEPNRKIAVVNKVLCQGCGTCVATCPSGAAAARHFTDEQLNAEISAVLHD